MTLKPFRVVTELMSGGDLKSFIRKNTGSIQMERKMKWIVDIANAMEHLIREGN